MSQIFRLTLALSMLAARASLAAETEFSAEQIAFFETSVRPLLVEQCHACHGPQTQEAGLRLDARAAILRGGDTGPALIAGRPDESELIRAVRYDPDGYQMPPDGKLSDEQIGILTLWVKMGAPWPADAGGGVQAAEEFDLRRRARRWSFQPLSRPVVPSIDDDRQSRWGANPIDRFILSRLSEAGLTPAPTADRATLLRRASFDVVGLPPSPQQVEQFAADETPGAWERLVDDLLASPHYGERWGRHWLDLVRYADSRGHEFDYEVANAHQYRDYVIRALNADVPYDQFVVEHVAGDLLVAVGNAGTPASHSLRLHPQTGANESILGTGFWFLGEWVHSPVDIRADEAERFANMIDVYSKTFLGLTVACARCHDHKFDPITTRDYYALQGYLQSSGYRQAHFETEPANSQIADELQALRTGLRADLLEGIRKAWTPVVTSLDEYLLAACGVMHSSDFQRGLNAEQLKELCANQVQAEELVVHRLEAWVRHLERAGSDDRDPFYWFGQLCSGDLASGAALQARLRDAPGTSARLIHDAPAVHHNVLFSASELMTDSPAIQPVLPGDVLLSDDAQHPVAGMMVTGSLRFDPLFESMAPSAASTPEPGALGEHKLSGRIVRTPTFELTDGHIGAKVLGPVTTHVVVDSHQLIRGPLHGSHVQHHADSEEWRIIQHDVSRYAGHRVHVEVIGRPGHPFAVQSVWEQSSPAPPAGQRPWLTDELSQLFEQQQTDKIDLQDVAQAYRNVFAAEMLHELRHCLGHADERFDGEVIIADWGLRHPRLFGLDDPAFQRNVRSITAAHIERQQQLAARVRETSATAPVMCELSGENESVFIRGSSSKLGDVVPRRFLEVFSGKQMLADENYPGGTPAAAVQADSDSGSLPIGAGAYQPSGRLHLARWMVDPAQTPILPRVIVNRIWQHYFGIGIVPTPDDFGYMGQDPSHPELLDWLASELVARDWSLKHIHRLILTSSTYRMSSMAGAGLPLFAGPEVPADHGRHSQSGISPAEIDPANRLLWRQNVKRLEGEAIRDAILAVSGRFDERMYGRSIPVHLTAFMEGRGRPAESGPVDGDGRRSLYIAVRRNFPDPFLQAFDMPNPHTTIGRRNVSNVPAQALAMLNNPFVIQQARRWGRQLVAQRPSVDPEALIRQVWLAGIARQPHAGELRAAVDFLESQAAALQTQASDPRVWGDLCHVLLNSKEFLFVR